MTEYIRSLRSVVGTRPLMQCGASVILCDEQARVLMLRRADNTLWCFPGGSIELGESVEEAARRETFEESGLLARTLRLFHVFSGQELYYMYPNGDEVYNVDVVYFTRDYEGQVRIDAESTDWRFFSLSEIPDELSPPHVPIVRYLRENPQWITGG